MTSANFNVFERSWKALLTVFRRGGRPARQAYSNYPILPRRLPLLLFLLCLSTFVVCGFALFDDDVARYAQGHKAHKTSAFLFFRATTDIGTAGWVLVTTAILGLAISVMNLKLLPRARRWFWASLHADLNFTFFTVGVTGILASLIKNTIGRARPKHLDTLGHLEFDFARFEASFASFPSGHSTTFGALCMVLFLLLPRRLWPLWLVFAVLGGVSRIIVGAHYPSDVAAGLAFGGILTLLAARWLAKRGVLFIAGSSIFPARKLRIHR